MIQVTLGAKEMKAPTIIPVSDGSPFRRQLGDKLGADATPTTPKRQLGDDAKLCNEIPRATCGSMAKSAHGQSATPARSATPAAPALDPNPNPNPNPNPHLWAVAGAARPEVRVTP